MIDCEWLCIKGKGQAARYRIFLKIDGIIVNICLRCLEYFGSKDYKILEDYRN